VAPLWGSFIDTGSTKAVLFVVDASAPEKLGTSTVHLVELVPIL
jgi:hypothetical protein